MGDVDRNYLLEVEGYRVGPLTGLEVATRVKRRFKREGYPAHLVPMISVEAAFVKLQEDVRRENEEFNR